MKLVAEEVRLRKEAIAGMVRKREALNEALMVLIRNDDDTNRFSEARSILANQVNSLGQNIKWENESVDEIEKVGYTFLYSDHVGCDKEYCPEAIKKNPATWNYFITTGHAGCKNGSLNWNGYKSKDAAKKVYKRALAKLKATMEELAK